MSNNQADVREIARAAIKTALAKGAQRGGRHRQPLARRRASTGATARSRRSRRPRRAASRCSSTSTAATRRSRPRTCGRRRSTTFIADSIAMTRVLAEDPFRTLPDPALYAGPGEGRPAARGPGVPERHARAAARTAAQQMEQAARAVKGADAILSVSTGFHDTRNETFRVASNGFEGHRVDTVVLLLGAGEREGRGRPPARGVRLRRRALRRPGASGRRHRPPRGRARALARSARRRRRRP